MSAAGKFAKLFCGFILFSLLSSRSKTSSFKKFYFFAEERYESNEKKGTRGDDFVFFGGCYLGTGLRFYTHGIKL